MKTETTIRQIFLNTLTIVVFLTVFLFVNSISAKTIESDQSEAAAKSNSEDKFDFSATPTWTVFVKKQFGAPRSTVLNDVNESHANMAKKGWTFKELDIYTENGDLQGFIVTYTRDINSH